MFQIKFRRLEINTAILSKYIRNFHIFLWELQTDSANCHIIFAFHKFSFAFHTLRIIKSLLSQLQKIYKNTVFCIIFVRFLFIPKSCGIFIMERKVNYLYVIYSYLCMNNKIKKIRFAIRLMWIKCQKFTNIRYSQFA